MSPDDKFIKAADRLRKWFEISTGGKVTMEVGSQLYDRLKEFDEARKSLSEQMNGGRVCFRALKVGEWFRNCAEPSHLLVRTRLATSDYNAMDINSGELFSFGPDATVTRENVTVMAQVQKK